MNFDLAAIDTKTLSEEGVDMGIKLMGSDEPLLARNGKPVTIKLLGPDSDTYRNISRAQLRKRLLRTNDAKNLNALDFDEIETEALDLLAACVVGWENVLDTNGKDIPFSKDAARKLLENYPVVREQVDAFVATRAHFLKASPES